MTLIELRALVERKFPSRTTAVHETLWRAGAREYGEYAASIFRADYKVSTGQMEPVQYYLTAASAAGLAQKIAELPDDPAPVFEGAGL